MTSYILAENPELTASEAIERSKQMMSGNRWRLFCMQISFIGWDILSALLTFGIGGLWITPYARRLPLVAGGLLEEPLLECIENYRAGKLEVPDA